MRYYYSLHDDWELREISDHKMPTRKPSAGFQFQSPRREAIPLKTKAHVL